MRLLMNEFEEALDNLVKSEQYQSLKETLHRTVTIATGRLTYSTLVSFSERLMKYFPGLTIHVVAIRNDFFGETITVSGLITGQDLISQLKEQQDAGVKLGDTLNIPINMLRSGEKVFLDDVTVADVEKALNMHIAAVEANGRDFIEAIINPKYCSDRENENFVYIQAYDR